jgi:hypothetical protein
MRRRMNGAAKAKVISGQHLGKTDALVGRPDTEAFWSEDNG